MIVCICREIRESDYPDPDDLRDRVMADDYVCGQCQLAYDILEENNNEHQKNS